MQHEGIKAMARGFFVDKLFGSDTMVYNLKQKKTVHFR